MGTSQSSGKGIERSRSASVSGYYADGGRNGRGINNANQQNQCNSYNCQQCNRMATIANQASCIATSPQQYSSNCHQCNDTSNGCKSCNIENQFHHVNSSPSKIQNIYTPNYPNNNGGAGSSKMRYKSPQQQYQYHNHNLNIKTSNITTPPTSATHSNSSNMKNTNVVPLYSSHTIGRNTKTQSTSYNSQNSKSTSNCAGSLKRIKSSPMSAQQASYEAMRTIDMYLIRQIARNFLDFDLERKIDNEIQIREGTTAMLANAKHELQQLEIEKSLLASDQRMNCYAIELQQRRLLASEKKKQQQDSNNNNDHNNRASPRQQNHNNNNNNNHGSNNRRHHLKDQAQVPTVTPNKHQEHTGKMSPVTSSLVEDSKATITISDIRIPLMWRDVDHFKNRGDYKCYAIFCLLRIDSQIYDTQLIGNVDRQITDITFDDFTVSFSEISHNFQCQLEVYSCVYMEEFSIASTPRKLKRKLTNSVSRAMGRRMATASASYARELQAYDKSYRFDLIANAILRLSDASKTIKTYDLMVVSGGGGAGGGGPASPSTYRHMSAMSTISSATLYNQSQNGCHTTGKNSVPLFGHFCARLSVKPDCLDKIMCTGYLKVLTVNQHQAHHQRRDSTSSASAKAQALKMSTLSMSSAALYWGMLRNFEIQLWPINERISPVLKGELVMPSLDFKPHLIVPIDRHTQILRASNSTLTLDTSLGCFIMSANHGLDYGQAVIELTGWLRAVEQQIHDNRTWAHVIDHYLPAASETTNAPSYQLQQRQQQQQQQQQQRVDCIASSRIMASSARHSSQSSSSSNSDSWMNRHGDDAVIKGGHLANKSSHHRQHYSYINNVRELPIDHGRHPANSNIDSKGSSRKVTPTESDIDDGYATTMWLRHNNGNSKSMYEQTGL